MNPSRICSLAWAMFALPFLLAASLTHAASQGVRDQAGFFSETAVANANRTISDIEKNLKRELVVETYREIPADQRRGVDLQDKAAVKRLFESWSVQRARELGINGVYVLLTREPSHLQIAVGNQTQRQAFTLADRDALASRMLERLRAKDYDSALLNGVQFVQQTLRAHATPSPGPRSQAAPASSAHRTPAATPAQPPRPTTPASPAAPASPGFSFLTMLLPFLLIGLVILVGIRLIARLFGRGSNFGGTPPPLGAGAGGGGFMRSMLGGLFGAAAGMWLYNMFTGSHTSAWGSDIPPTSGNPNDGFSGQDTDYSSSGSDFGDSSGGGDFGGGGDF